MGFGILAGFPPLDILEYAIGSTSEVLATADRLDPSGTLRRITADIRHPMFCPTCLFGFSDIIPLASGMLRARGSTIVRLPVPSEYVVGLTCHREVSPYFVYLYGTRLAYLFYKTSPSDINTRLTPSRHSKSSTTVCNSTSPPTPTPHLPCCAGFSHNTRPSRPPTPNGKTKPSPSPSSTTAACISLEDVHTIWDTATKYFTDLEATKPPLPRLRYTALMAAHIAQAVHYWKDATDRVKGENGQRPREHFGGKDWVAEGAHCHWDYLPIIAAGVRAKGCQIEDEVVREAWCVMMLRAFFWWRTHYMVGLGEEGGKVEMGVEVGRLPSRWWGSRLPVYVG
ncbi:hypothetical protein MMC17_007317 [Xylographa soralifera]|nr:hypothetical protein [Xylographa soralifera]